MATAKKVYPEHPYSIVLTLSQEEAEALLRVADFIAGDRCNSPRKSTDGIQQALYAAGVAYRKLDVCAGASIIFKAYPKGRE